MALEVFDFEQLVRLDDGRIYLDPEAEKVELHVPIDELERAHLSALAQVRSLIVGKLGEAIPVYLGSEA